MAQTVVREMTHSSVVQELDAWSEVDLVQRSQSVFAALLHVHCLLEAPHLLAPVASRCHFVGSSHGPEKTVKRYIWLLSNETRIHIWCEQNVQEIGETSCSRFALSTCALDRDFEFFQLRGKIQDLEYECRIRASRVSIKVQGK